MDLLAKTVTLFWSPLCGLPAKKKVTKTADMKSPPLLSPTGKANILVAGSIILFFTVTSVRLCQASEQTYDGKTLVAVGSITGGNGVRSLSGLTYNRPTAAGNFIFIPAGDYYVDARVVNPVYFFKQIISSPQSLIALYGNQSCQQRYTNYPGVEKGLVTNDIHVSGYIVVAGLGCVNISGGSLGWNFGFFGSPIIYDPTKFSPAVRCPDPTAETAFLATCPGALGSYDCATQTGKCTAAPCVKTIDADADGFSQCEDCDDGDNSKTTQCISSDKPDQQQGAKNACPQDHGGQGR